jgi:glycosyltransferase involved in cell wall biosynthesis
MPPKSKPLIFYSIGERLGAQGLSLVARLAGEALQKEGMLQKLLCYGYAKKFTGEKIRNISVIFFQPAKLFSFLSAKYYYTMKRRWADFISSHLLKKLEVDIFHGWAHSSIKSIRVAKKRGIISILERGNSHPLHTRKILTSEYKKYRVDDFFGEKETNPLLNIFNLWRYEFDEALLEINECDYLFLNSDFCAKTYIKHGVDPKKIIIIPRGFDPSFYKTRPIQKQEDTFVVLFVGNLLLRKGIKYILESWDELKLKRAELWFVGNTTNEVKFLFDEYLPKYKNIKLIGEVSNPSIYYKEASVFLFPSIDEGSAKVTYEAMASGLPCIFTENAGSVATEENALIIPIRSKDAISSGLKKLYYNVHLRNNLGKKARAHIKNFTWEFYQKTLINQYQKIFDAHQ